MERTKNNSYTNLFKIKVDKVQNNFTFGFKNVYVTSEIKIPFKYF